MFLYLPHVLSIDCADFQLESYELAALPRLLLLWFRGSGKSMTWSVGYPLWKLLSNPDHLDLRRQLHDIFCISRTSSLVEKWVRLQKRELIENNDIRVDYDPQPSDQVWRNDEYEIKDRGRVKSIGVGSQFRGEHPTDAVLDDVEDREEARSEAQREKLREWFYGDFMGALRLHDEKASRVKIVGNLVHPLGLMNELANLDWWEVRKYAIQRPDGKPTWPAYADEAKITQLRERLPYSVFMAEMMNEPVAAEDPVFIRDWLNEYDDEDEEFLKRMREDGFFTVIAVDPAISRRDRADYTGLVTISGTRLKPERYYVRTHGVTRHRGTTEKTIAEIARLKNEFNAHRIIIETTAFQKALGDEWRRYCEIHRWHANLQEVNPVKDKEIRARAVQGLVSRGEVFFNVSDPMTQKLIDEMVTFPGGDHDDLFDAFIYALTELQQWAGRDADTQQKPYVVLPEGARNPLTGVVR